jgi:cobalt/nickel transport system ATP-binding protein
VQPLIEVRNLRYCYEDGTEALNGVDFRLDVGEAVALLGANGSGKTTFVMHLNGLLGAEGGEAGRGSVEVCGLSVNKHNLVAIRRKIGMVFQDSESQLFMPTVLEDVAFGPLNLGLDPASAMERANTELQRVGMAGAGKRAPYHLSAGEKKRVAIAGILAMDPEILVLDEPTTFLDPPGQRSLADLLQKLPQAKILVTHDTSFARSICTRAVFFQDGAIKANGSIEDVVYQFGWDVAAARSLTARIGAIKEPLPSGVPSGPSSEQSHDR